MLPELNVCGDTIPDTYNPDEFINSATEVATPSNANTPDLAVADQAVHESKKFVDRDRLLTSSTARLRKSLIPNPTHTLGLQNSLHR